MSDTFNEAINDAFTNPTPLNEQFIVQRAGANDLADILAIYNQSIAGKQATANLVAVTTDERQAWFSEHFDNAKRPIYVVKTAMSNQNNPPSTIVAWGSFSDLYSRSAYHISSEISVYLHRDHQGQGLGKLLTAWMLTQAPSLGIRNIVALVFAHNEPSLKLFGKLGFEQWGYMPQVCDMDGFIADVVMLGRAVEV